MDIEKLVIGMWIPLHDKRRRRCSLSPWRLKSFDQNFFCTCSPQLCRLGSMPDTIQPQGASTVDVEHSTSTSIQRTPKTEIQCEGTSTLGIGASTISSSVVRNFNEGVPHGDMKSDIINRSFSQSVLETTPKDTVGVVGQASYSSFETTLTKSTGRRKTHVSVTVQERMRQDPLLAEHFAQLECPTADATQNHNEGSGSKCLLKSTSRLKRTTDSVGIKYVNQYIVIKRLGHGTFGKVKLCLNTVDCKLYAVKIIHRKWVSRHSIGGTKDNVGKGAMREIAIMKKLNHPNIVALNEVIDDPSNRKLYLVLEYVEGGPIMDNDFWHSIPEDKARLYFRDMCQGLDYLHFNKIVHRDLKPGNLLLTMDGKIKISDFGVSHMFDQSDSVHGTAGTPAFLAPEMCVGGECQGRAADIWALGLMYTSCSSVPSLWSLSMTVIMTGAYCFQGGPWNMYGPFAEIMPAIISSRVHKQLLLGWPSGADDLVISRELQLAFPSKTRVSRSLKNLLSLILTKDPNSRITVAGIMQHDWVTNQGLEPLIPFKLQTARVSTATAVSEDEVKAAINVNQAGLAALSNLEPVEKHFEPGEYIMRQGEEGHEMYLINSGECEVLVESRSLTQPSKGRMEYAIAERGPGQYIGEMALSTDNTRPPSKRTASIRAKSHVVTLVVSRDQVMDVLSKNAEAAQSIADTIAERDKEMRRRMTAWELRLPSSRHINELQNNKYPPLVPNMPSGSFESAEDITRHAAVCLNCRIL